MIARRILYLTLVIQTAVFLAVLLLTTITRAEELPAAPETAGIAISSPRKPIVEPFMASKVNRALVGGEFLTRTMDIISTHQDQDYAKICHCLHEASLPNVVAQHMPLMTAYSLGVAAGYTLLADELWKHNHHKISRAVLMFDISYDGRDSINNWALLGSKVKK